MFNETADSMNLNLINYEIRSFLEKDICHKNVPINNDMIFY